MGLSDEGIGPDAIILDIAPSMIDFHNKIFDLGLAGVLTKEEIVSGMISYLHDEETAHGSLLEYTRDLATIFTHGYSSEDIDEFTNAVNELGADIICQLQEIVAYDDAGALWYEFHEFCGDDIVLKRSTLSTIPPPRKSK